MKYVIVGIKDRVADNWNPPYVMPSVGVAIRQFTDEVNRAAEDNIFYRHADDFDLYKLAYFESDTGLVEPVSHEKLILGREAKLVGDAGKLRAVN